MTQYATDDLRVDGELDVSGGGSSVKFPTGSWSPGLSFGGGTTGITYSADRGGRWTKIGPLYHLSGRVVLTNKGSSTGAALLTGLPAAAKNSGLAQVPPTLYIENITFADVFQALVLPGSAAISLYETTKAGVVTPLTDADFANNSAIYVNLIYEFEP